MIVPMKKITLLVVEKERKKALAKLRSLGVMHIEKTEVNSEEITRLNAVQGSLATAKVILDEVLPAKKRKKAGVKTLSHEETIEVAEQVVSLDGAKKEKKARIEYLRAELARLTKWGDIDPLDFDALIEEGVYLRPVIVRGKNADALLKEYRYLSLPSDKKNRFVLLWTDEALDEENLAEEITPLEMPELSTASMKAEIKTLLKGCAAIDAELYELALKSGGFADLDAKLVYDLEYEAVVAGLKREYLHDVGDDDALASSNKELEIWQPDNLVWLKGFAPADTEATIKATVAEEGWACVVAEPDEEDPVPTKLKNNRFVNLITPLTDFLGTIPGYREPDVSLWFLIFFGIFFGMIFNDAGYGSVMSIGVIIAMIITKLKGKQIANAMYMFLYLGLFSVAWGVITCSWFGIAPEYLPDVLKKYAVYGISSLAEQTARNKNLMALSFTLGVVHLAIARIISIIRNRKTLKFFGEIGSLSMLIGMYVLVLNMIVDSTKYPMGKPFIIAIAAGFVLKFVFDYYETSIGQSILDSLKNFIAVFLGVVNVFADIVSYIRLWAVGLAGGAISMVVNQFVGPTLGSLIMFLGLALFIFGHGFNVVLSVLSVIVHGVRLNTMEFSTHVGLTWSGIKYEPFSETLEK